VSTFLESRVPSNTEVLTAKVLLSLMLSQGSVV